MHPNNRTMQLSELCPEKVRADGLGTPLLGQAQGAAQQIQPTTTSKGPEPERSRPSSRQMVEPGGSSAPPKAKQGGPPSTNNLSANSTYIVKQVLLQTLPKEPQPGPRPSGKLPDAAALPASIRDFFDLSATIFNSRALSPQQAIDKAAALDLLARAHSKHAYVTDTIEKAKAKHQKKGGELPDFTQEEIVDQMIKLAEIDLAKEAKQRKKAAKRAEEGASTVAAGIGLEKMTGGLQMAGLVGGQYRQGGGLVDLSTKEVAPLRKAVRQNSCAGQMQKTAEEHAVLERLDKAEAMNSTVIEGNRTMQLQIPVHPGQRGFVDERILDISGRQSNMSMLTAEADPPSKRLQPPLRLKSNRSAQAFREANASSALSGPVNFMSKLQNHVHKNAISSKENSITRQGLMKAESSGLETNMTSLPGASAELGHHEKQKAPPRPPKQHDGQTKKFTERCGNQTVVIDENTDFLIKNLNNQNFWTTANHIYPKERAGMDEGALLSTFDIRPAPKMSAVADLDFKRKKSPRAREVDLTAEQPSTDRTTFLEMQSRSTIPANNFKLLLKCMKLWKKYTQMCREKRKQSAKEMEQRIQALAHREQWLINISFKCFKDNREDQERMRQCSKIVRYQVNRNIKKFYFDTMRRKFIRIQRRRYLKQVAKKFHLEQRKCKCLKYWRRVSHRRKVDSDGLYDKIISKSPYAAEILLEDIAYHFYIGQDAQAQTSAECDDPFITNIVKFHFYALKHFTPNKASASQQHIRIRPPAAPRFSSAVEFILRQKQYRVLRCLARNRDNMQCFRRMKLFRFKRRCLDAIGRVAIEKRKLRFLKYKVSRRLMSSAFDAIARYWQARAQLKERYEQLRTARTCRVQARYLSEWRDLWAYYSKFTQSTYCYSDGKKSRQKFLVKHFGMLKAYWLMRQKHRLNMLVADSKFADRYTKICFQNWAWYTLHFCRNARYAKAQTTKKYTAKFKREYFNAIKRAYSNSVKCREFAATRLKKRVIKSLKHRRQFLQLKQTITQICVDKYETNILRKSFLGMMNYSTQKVQLKSLEKVLTKKHSNRIREKVVLALQLNVERSYQKKMDTNFLKKMHQANQKRRILLGMSSYAQFRKDLRVRAQALQLQQKHTMQRRYFVQMYLRYCKKNSDRQISANMRKRREQQMAEEKFTFWLKRYRNLRKCERMVTSRVHKQVSFDMFKLWRARFYHEKDLKFKNRDFLERQRAKQLRIYWTAFTERLFIQKRESEMKEAAKWFFWKNKSSIVLRELYVYAEWRKKKRYILDQQRLDRLARAFQTIKRTWEVNATLRRALGSKKQDIVSNVFIFMKQYSQRKRYLKVRLEGFGGARREQRLRALFEVLRNPQLYTNIDIRRLQVHELYKLIAAFSGWKTHAKRAKQLRRQQDQLQKMRRGRLLRTHLYDWRYLLYLQGKEQKVVLPLREERQSKLIKGVFDALRADAALRKQKRYAKDTADSYYRESLLTKSLESMRWNSNQIIHHRNLVEYMSLTRSKIYLKACFEHLRERKAAAEELRAKETVVKRKNEALKCFTMFEYWLKLAQQKQIIDNDLGQITALYERQLKAKLFKALYEHRTTKIVRKTLTKRADLHQHEALLRKAYEAVAWYALVHKKRKANLRTQAEVWRKRKMLALWYQVLLKTMGNEGEEVCEVAMSRNTSVELRGTMARTGGSVPESTPQSVEKPISQDDQQELYFGQESFSHQRRNQSQISFGHDQNQQSKGRSQKSPLTDALRSLDMPLQLQAHHSKRSPPKIHSTSEDFDLSDLNTSEELRRAHDDLSFKLQELLKHTQTPNGESQHDAVQTEIAVLKELISLIKNKYQVARQNEEAGEEAAATEAEVAHPDGDSQQIAQDIPSDASMVQEEEDPPSQSADDSVLEERAAHYHVSRVKLKVLASIKLFNQQANGAYYHYPQMLVRRVMNALKGTRWAEDPKDTDALLEGAVNQRKMVKVLQALRDQAVDGRTKVELAIQHHRCRQVRVVLFALKKHQLVTIMQKTIVQGRLDRLKERIFWEWRVAFARAIKQREEQAATHALPLQGSGQKMERPAEGTAVKAHEEEEAIFQVYLHGVASEDRTSSGEKMKQATSKFGSSLQNEYNFDKRLDDILGSEAVEQDNEVDYEEEDDDVHDIQQFQDFRNLSAINPAGPEALAATKQSLVGLAKLAHGLSGELISEVDLASGLPKLEDFKGEEDEIEKIQAEIEGSEREDFQTGPSPGDATIWKTTGNLDFRDFDEEYMRMNSIEKKDQVEKPSIIDSRPRRESEARSEIRSVIRATNGDELGFDADPQPFHGFNDDSDENDEDSLDDFARYDTNVQAKAVEELDQIEFEQPAPEQIPNSGQDQREDSKFLPPLQQISEARSIEEVTPGVVFNKYKQAKFQTRQPQRSQALSSQGQLSTDQQQCTLHTESKKSEDFNLKPETMTEQSKNDGDDYSDF